MADYKFDAAKARNMKNRVSNHMQTVQTTAQNLGSQLKNSEGKDDEIAKALSEIGTMLQRFSNNVSDFKAKFNSKVEQAIRELETAKTQSVNKLRNDIKNQYRSA